MMYPQGGGLTDERRAFRERLRLEAAELFATGHSNTEIAKRLRVSVRSVQRRRHAWRWQGTTALRSRGSPGRPALSPELFAKLEAELTKGPVAHGWPDQTWTLARIKTLIGRRFHKSMTLAGIPGDAAPARLEPPGPRPPGERTRPRTGHRLDQPDLAAGGTTAAALDAWIVFEDEAGFSMTPPTRRTWSPRGHTPVITVRGRPQRRFSVAAPACYKAGERSRLIYRPRHHTDHKRGGRQSFTWTDYRDLMIAAHHQLGGPIVLVWDNLNVHRDARMRAFINACDWLSVFYLPTYAPDLNPVEGIWSLLRRSGQANTAFTDPDHLMRTLRRGLRQIQHRSHLIDGCLAATGLTLTTSPINPQ
ncbi:IS630 family transposase [Spirillospora sp. NPDC050679]